MATNMLKLTRVEMEFSVFMIYLVSGFEFISRRNLVITVFVGAYFLLI